MRGIAAFVALSLSAIGCRPARAPEQGIVVFVCEHGAAKSVIAAAHFNRLAAQRGLGVRAIARGGDPQPQPSTATVAGLRGDGLLPAPSVPQPLTGRDVRGSAHLVAFDCAAPSMKSLSAVGTCWDDVPPISEGYAAARDKIRDHVTALLDETAGRP